MRKAISPLSYNIEMYKQIKDILKKPSNVSLLPIVGESKIFKPSADRYGHVIIRLDLETEGDFYGSLNKYNYKWEINSHELFSDGYTPIPKHYEQMIIKEIEVFVVLLDFLNYNTPPLRFTLVGGSDKLTERPYFDRATAEAIIQIFKELHQD
ncbi:hypothetical protein [Pedobacter sp. R20-19]|uniref:hypothetical protein n=1 Tax=Pedobacter sp. R20-19 TaxID=1270196 RepID=UPI000493AF4C|nr:hypothetical protein [Pedobacter sp. R20-19]